jgi:hypothetical protein
MGFLKLFGLQLYNMLLNKHCHVVVLELLVGATCQYIASFVIGRQSSVVMNKFSHVAWNSNI